MNEQCQKTLQQIDSWLELNRQEKQAVLDHTRQCASCSRVLSSMQDVMNSLNRAAEGYNRMRFPGRMPPLPEKKIGRLRFFAPAPALGWSAVAILLVIFMVWSAGDRPPTMQLADRQGVSRVPRMPPMPKRSPGMTAISISPGSVSGRLPKLERKLKPAFRRHLRMPSKPKRSKGDLKKEISTIQTYQV